MGEDEGCSYKCCHEVSRRRFKRVPQLLITKCNLINPNLNRIGEVYSPFWFSRNNSKMVKAVSLDI